MVLFKGRSLLLSLWLILFGTASFAAPYAALVMDALSSSISFAQRA